MSDGQIVLSGFGAAVGLLVLLSVVYSWGYQDGKKEK